MVDMSPILIDLERQSAHHAFNPAGDCLATCPAMPISHATPTPQEPEPIVRELLCKALQESVLTPITESRVIVRLTHGVIRRALREVVGPKADPIATFRQTCSMLAAQCGAAKVQILPPRKGHELLLALDLDQRCSWPEAIHQFCGLRDALEIVNRFGPEVVNIRFEEPYHDLDPHAHRRTSDFLSEHILTHQPISDRAPLVLLRVHSMAALAKAFPQTRFDDRGVSGDELESLFRNQRIAPDLGIDAAFGTEQAEWRLVLCPITDWPTVKAQIRQQRDLLSSRIASRMSREAASLCAWIESLDPSEMLDDWSPYIEPVMTTEVGLDSGCWVEGEESDYVAALIEEINQRTHHSLHLQRWEINDPPRSRIHVGQKPWKVDEGARELKRLAGELRPGERLAVAFMVVPERTSHVSLGS